MYNKNIKDAIALLASFALEQRYAQMKARLEQRTRYLTVCFENLYHEQNTSAAVRSMEAFGIQDVHIVDSEHHYRVNPDIALGSDKWIDIHRYASIESGIASLKNAGYRIVAAMPDPDAVPLPDFDLNRGKAAILFGTELTGLSPAAIAAADEHLYIPMSGFVESLNVSVSAAIIIYARSQRLRASSIDWQLTDEEYNNIMFRWLRQSVRASDAILRRMHTKAPPAPPQGGF